MVLLSAMILSENQPIARKLHLITKDYFGVLTQKLDHLDLDRYFYPLILIARSAEGLTQKELSIRLHIDKVTMSRMADYFVQLGYVSREANIMDRRTTVLRATEKARREIHDIESAMLEIDAQLFDTVTRTEKDTFLRIVDRLNENMAKLPKGQVKFDYKKIQRK